MLQIIALKRQTGEYQGKQYDNFNLICADYESKNKALIFGPEIETLKIKADDFMTSLGRCLATLGDKEITKAQHIEGLLINPVYNKYGGVVDFTLHKSDTPKS